MGAVALLLVLVALVAPAALPPADDAGLPGGLHDDADTDSAPAPSLDPLLPGVAVAPRVPDTARLGAPPASRASASRGPVTGRVPRAPPGA